MVGLLMSVGWLVFMCVCVVLLCVCVLFNCVCVFRVLCDVVWFVVVCVGS